MQFPATSASAFCVGSVPAPDAYLIANGTGFVKWEQSAYLPGLCGPGFPPCFNYSGAFQVSVTRVATTLTSTAAPRHMTSPQLVTFTAALTPPSAGGVGVPYIVQNWRDTSDSGVVNTSPCPVPPSGTNPAVCTFTPQRSGDLEVTVLANGIVKRASAHLNVLNCLTGDSLLDDSRVRKGLRGTWNAANPNGPAADRRERAGMLYRDAAGNIIPVTFPLDPTATPCLNHYPSAADINQYGTPIYQWHVHPFRPDRTDPLPANCRGGNPAPGTVMWAQPNPSANDYNNGPAPWLVVDGLNGYSTPGFGPPQQTVTYKRSKCDFLS